MTKKSVPISYSEYWNGQDFLDTQYDDPLSVYPVVLYLVPDYFHQLNDRSSALKYFWQFLMQFSRIFVTRKKNLMDRKFLT